MWIIKMVGRMSWSTKYNKTLWVGSERQHCTEEKEIELVLRAWVRIPSLQFTTRVA